SQSAMNRPQDLLLGCTIWQSQLVAFAREDRARALDQVPVRHPRNPPGFADLHREAGLQALAERRRELGFVGRLENQPRGDVVNRRRGAAARVGVAIPEREW